MDNVKGEEVDAYTRAVSNILRAAKEHRGVSFSALAEETGLGRATVVRVLNGERNITLNYLKLLADALALDPADVLETAESPTPLTLPVDQRRKNVSSSTDNAPTEPLSLDERRRIAAERAAAAAEAAERLVAQQDDGLPKVHEDGAPPTHDEGADHIPDTDDPA